MSSHVASRAKLPKQLGARITFLQYPNLRTALAPTNTARARVAVRLEIVSGLDLDWDAYGFHDRLEAIAHWRATIATYGEHCTTLGILLPRPRHHLILSPSHRPPSPPPSPPSLPVPLLPPLPPPPLLPPLWPSRLLPPDRPPLQSRHSTSIHHPARHRCIVHCCPSPPFPGFQCI